MEQPLCIHPGHVIKSCMKAGKGEWKVLRGKVSGALIKRLGNPTVSLKRKGEEAGSLPDKETPLETFYSVAIIFQDLTLTLKVGVHGLVRALFYNFLCLTPTTLTPISDLRTSQCCGFAWLRERGHFLSMKLSFQLYTIKYLENTNKLKKNRILIKNKN